MSDSLEIQCPCCDAELVVDRMSGEVLFHKQKQRTRSKSLEEMVSAMENQKADRDKMFEKGIENQKDRQRILEARFREAMQRAEKEKDTPRINPLDLD
jgi:uncharacterized Zn finger protein (UPF0148 family)